MVARFMRYWPAALADNVLPNYGTLVARSGTEFGSSDERTIFFLTEYIDLRNWGPFHNGG
ncbi:uncharacterized protein CCOS01_05118 [Colletotrichum costaricense]|uniref:Uncharacterized protein n=1 Tax=Colletotrichum costaricense TaxID=1209916 RepID=A0AAI9YZU4_9PEZI|nr:uncharacterized protein CCOS01_05118 [Colletotrichum costaricense]KAK1530015.1 hypothetical protein CCOS01_05118 [Colletotrichum costaricense]